MPSSTPSLGLRSVTKTKRVQAAQFMLALSDPEASGGGGGGASRRAQDATSEAALQVDRNCTLSPQAALALRGSMLASLLVPSALAGPGGASTAVPVLDQVLISGCYFFDSVAGVGVNTVFSPQSSVRRACLVMWHWVILYSHGLPQSCCSLTLTPFPLVRPPLRADQHCGEHLHLH